MILTLGWWASARTRSPSSMTDPMNPAKARQIRRQFRARFDDSSDDSSTCNNPVSTGTNTPLPSTKPVRTGTSRDAVDEPVGWGFESLRARWVGMQGIVLLASPATDATHEWMRCPNAVIRSRIAVHDASRTMLPTTWPVSNKALASAAASRGYRTGMIGVIAPFCNSVKRVAQSCSNGRRLR